MHLNQEQEIAISIFNILPPSMHRLRVELRSAAAGKLGVPQFRVLANVYGGMLYVSEIAAHHGVSQPAMSKMVEILVKQNYLNRKACKIDRRQNELALTKKGESLFLKIREAAEKRVQARLTALTKDEKKILADGLQQLKKCLLN